MQEKNFNHIILEPNLCYGCGACVATCPKKCLKFEKDVLGFTDGDGRRLRFLWKM